MTRTPDILPAAHGFQLQECCKGGMYVSDSKYNIKYIRKYNINYIAFIYKD